LKCKEINKTNYLILFIIFKKVLDIFEEVIYNKMGMFIKNKRLYISRKEKI
jgi:hypothetical protein